jgi:hypothetical protein
MALLETTVCPSRLLEEDDGEAWRIFRWWSSSTTFDGMSGRALGPPEWPRPGGLVKQDALLACSVDVLRSEWALLLGSQRDTSRAAEDQPQHEERSR